MGLLQEASLIVAIPHAIVCVALLFATPGYVANAQEYPSRPIRIVVPVEAGGSPDILARMIGEKLHERWGQTVVVENRAGASQTIGSDLVAKSAPDGYTILLPSVTYTTSAAIQSKLPFDPVNDLTGITMIGESPFVVTVHPSLPVKTIKDLIALAKAKPGSLNYASSGTGSILHLVTEVMAASAKIKLMHVPYKSIAPALNETIGGHVPILIGPLPSMYPQVKAGRLRALAVTTDSRSPFAPELPTTAEAGIRGFVASGWWGVFAPGKTPRPVVTKLNSEIHRILAKDEVKSRLAREGASPVVNSPEAFGAFVKSEFAKWKHVAQALNLESN